MRKIKLLAIVCMFLCVTAFSQEVETTTVEEASNALTQTVTDKDSSTADETTTVSNETSAADEATTTVDETTISDEATTTADEAATASDETTTTSAETTTANNEIPAADETATAGDEATDTADETATTTTESTDTPTEEITSIHDATTANWLPQFGWSPDHFYLALDCGLSVPNLFGDEGAITGVGGGFSAETGYSCGNWLFGVRYLFDKATPGESSEATNINMTQNMFFINAALRIGQAQLFFLPDFLVVKGLYGIGVNAVSGTFDYRTNGKTYDYAGAAFIMDFGATAELVGAPAHSAFIGKITQWCTPYFGFDWIISFDKNGGVSYYAFCIGARTDYARISNLWRK